MSSQPSVAIIGATGVLGRPVTRRLVEEGFSVRVITRDARRAEAVVPDKCVVTQVDLRDSAALEKAIDGCGALYINLSPPMAKSHAERENPEQDGTRAAVAAAKRANIAHLLKISAMGIPEASDDWWAARAKLESDRAVLESGIPYTLFRPTWFMESIPMFTLGPFLLAVHAPKSPLYWIAGDDYGRQVAAALRSDRARNREFIVQGPEGVALADAVRRFARSYPSRLRCLPVPLAILRLNGVFRADARYLTDLLKMTFRYTTGLDALPTWQELGNPTMTIEQYAAYCARTGDYPSKSIG